MENIRNILKRLLGFYSKEETISLIEIKKKIEAKIKVELPSELLLNYLQERGFKHIDTSIAEIKKNDLIEKKDEEDEDDFDPNEFIEENIEQIQSSFININDFEDNTWLIDRYQNSHNIDYLTELVVKNRGLVESIATKYVKKYNNRLDYEDLVSEGIKGLFKAIEKFDTTLEYRFSTYATWWIRQATIRAIMNQSSTIRIPVHVFEQISKMITVETNCVRKFNELNVIWICEQLDITREKYNELKKIDHNILRLASLQSIASEEGDGSLLIDFIEYDPLKIIGAECDDYYDPYFIMVKEDLKYQLDLFIDTLNEREKDIINHRFGFYDGQIKTLEEVGALYNLTRERIRQIEVKALNKLKNELAEKGLAFMDMCPEI